MARHQRVKYYDTFLTISGLFLIYLYIFDPYYKLGAPGYITPPLKGKPDEDKVAIPNKPSQRQQLVQQNDNLVPEIPDARSLECKAAQRDITTSASIIINVRHLSRLRPTLKSLLKFTPRKYIYEVLLVDHGDLSPKDMAQLQHIGKDEIHNVSVVNNDKQGHVEARHKAAQQAQGEMLIFIETGTLVSAGWVEPILHLLQNKNKTFAVPRFDKISDDVSFGYLPQPYLQAPVIDRDITIKMQDVTSKDDFVPIGSIRRECFATRADYWRSIGGLDRDVGDVGGVHQEISLRLWQCGGSIHLAACSRVGIITLWEPLRVHHAVNAWRIDRMWISSETWRPFKYRDDEPKNIMDTMKKQVDVKMNIIRDTLKCTKDISQYVNRFVPAAPMYNLKPTPEDIAFQLKFKAIVPKKGGPAGLLRSVSAQQCLSPDKERTLKLGPCDWTKVGIPRENMTFQFMPGKKIKVHGRCVTVVKNNYLKVMDCDNMNEKWNYWEQQTYEWEESGVLKFWYSKECFLHVMDPDPKYQHRPVVMVQACYKDTSRQKNFANFELLLDK